METRDKLWDADREAAEAGCRGGYGGRGKGRGKNEGEGEGENEGEGDEAHCGRERLTRTLESRT